MPAVVIVVPCYNEANRLAVDDFVAFGEQHAGVDFLFVNDGSTDDTLGRIDEIAARLPSRVRVLDQQPNAGKAQAVRGGMLEAFASDAAFVGYWDADLATPLDEIPRFIDVFEQHPEREIVMGARVGLLGRDIRRSARRHYLGRIFATAASVTLGLSVYDTQCGAKLFRASDDMAALFRDAFCTNWIFDVEIIARLTQQRLASGGPRPQEVIFELPLDRWHDVAGSKVVPGDFPTALFEMFRIHRRYLRGGSRRRAG